METKICIIEASGFMDWMMTTSMDAMAMTMTCKIYWVHECI